MCLDGFSGDFHGFSLVIYVYGSCDDDALEVWDYDTDKVYVCVGGGKLEFKSKVKHFINAFLHEWLWLILAHVGVQCKIINLEYVECFWNPNSPTMNYTFSSA